jgi:2-polyprenyl-3-methyl-5-hydroxy-6-metoxy-1,4-benzoquinol methylase
MKRWNKDVAFSSLGEGRRSEVWSYFESDKKVDSFRVDVHLGKPLDVVGLKGTSLREVADYASFLKDKARELYAPRRKRREIKVCPCCDADTGEALEAFSVFDVAYKRCPVCLHAFVQSQPTLEDLSEVFAESEEHSSVYVDRDSLEIRLAQIIKPKLDWVREVYDSHYGREIQSLVDVGAGGGHFVEGARRSGLSAQGYEISRASRRFAREAFGLELLDKDFLAPDEVERKFDAITFWGLLEYTPEPKRFLEAARARINTSEGLLVVEVPRFDCVGTAIQKESADKVARHLDPTSHVNCFSDASLMTLLYTSGFRPVAAWYFGMDAYELLVQLAFQLGDDEAVNKLAHLIPGLQAAFDSAELCDDIVVAAVPLTSRENYLEEKNS